jgi:hypothetical protein
MKNINNFEEFLNERDTSEDINESFLLIAGLSILITLGIKGLRKIGAHVANTQELDKKELYDIVERIVSDSKDDVSSSDKSSILKWGDSMKASIDKGEIKTLKELGNFIDSTKDLFKK